MKIDITELKQTDSFAEMIAAYIQSSNELNIFYLNGNLGSGKTTLVRHILMHMGWEGSVKSPTFSILEEYKINNHDIFHADLYRLEGENDFDMLGLEINKDNKAAIFIEWADKIAPFDIENEIFLSLSLNANERCVEIKTKCKKFLNCIDGVNINNPI